MSKLLSWINKSNTTIENNKAVVYRMGEIYESISYKELYAYILSLSYFLKEYKGKTIAIIGNNKLEYVISLLSVICNIGDAYLIDKELEQEDINSLFEIKKPDLVILDDDINLSFPIKTVLFSDIQKIINDKHIFTIDDSFSGNLILHTSGSTGQPKCVSLSETQYLFIIKDLNISWKVNSSHSCLFIIPLYHIYALTSLFHGLYAGISNILEYDYARLRDALQKTNPGIFLGVPVIFNKIRNTAYEKAGKKLEFAIFISKFLLLFKLDIRKKLFSEIHNYFGSNYYFSVCGGSLFDPKVNKFFNDIGLPVYNGYGMTETSGPVAICYENNNDYFAVGKILHNEVTVINPDEKGIGEICISGPNIITEYVNKSLEDTFTDGFFNTGDLGYVKNGFLYITGRKKNILIGDNGKNIAVQELVDRILENKEIYDCTISLHNNRICAALDTSLSRDEINTYMEKVNETLPNYKKISDINIVDKGFRNENS